MSPKNYTILIKLQKNVAKVVRDKKGLFSQMFIQHLLIIKKSHPVIPFIRSPVFLIILKKIFTF